MKRYLAMGLLLLIPFGFDWSANALSQPEADAPDWFDYEKMRKAAQDRSGNEMANWETLALAADRDSPTLVDGGLEPRLSVAATRGLVVGHQDAQRQLLHAQAWRTRFVLKPGQRTPYFHVTTTRSGIDNKQPVATWFVKIAGGTEA